MKILRDKQVGEKIGNSSRSTVWRKAKEEPDFPKPIKFNDRLTGWVESEVDAYIAKRVALVRGAVVPDDAPAVSPVKKRSAEAASKDAKAA